MENDTVYRVGQIERGERSLAVFAQDILNRKGKRVFVDIDNYKLYVDEPMTEVGLWQLIEENAGMFAGSKQDYFISGVSGIGYANCLSYPREHLDKFTELTSQAMRDSDLRVVCLLDNISLTQNKESTRDRLSSYAKFDNIDGEIWELDPDRYGSGHGKIFYACGKPFASVRFTMWHPSCREECVTHEWLDGIVRDINAMPVAPDREEGYSVINVHPWTMSMESLDYVVSRLSDHVELVYADELLRLIKENVKRS